MSHNAKGKFTARQPKPRQAPVEPLQEAQKDAAETATRTATKGALKVDGKKPKELGGPSGPEPTRYGDWERKGICVDF
ncbi:succinate dehydrogenase assembly factor 4 [Pelagibius sp. CAU 1746]|uniref:DUF1674 domain-containing protein n=1 Tax=Pelagibius sp. CAU 1746 TaxID=3140370 RepID=UPI00325BC3E1